MANGGLRPPRPLNRDFAQTAPLRRPHPKRNQKILFPTLQSIRPLKRTMKKDQVRGQVQKPSKRKKSNPRPPEKMPQVGFLPHPIENKHVTSKLPLKTKDLRIFGHDQFSKQRTYIRPSRTRSSVSPRPNLQETAALLRTHKERQTSVSPKLSTPGHGNRLRKYTRNILRSTILRA
jgi:hypothetical protein